MKRNVLALGLVLATGFGMATANAAPTTTRDATAPAAQPAAKKAPAKTAQPKLITTKTTKTQATPYGKQVSTHTVTTNKKPTRQPRMSSEVNMDIPADVKLDEKRVFNSVNEQKNTPNSETVR